MYLRFGANPNFAKAWSGIDEYIRKNTETYVPHFSKDKGGQSILENLLAIKSKYIELVDATKRMGDLRFGEGFEWARGEYNLTASAMFGDDLEKNQAKFEFGFSPEVIAQMEDSGAKELAEEVYETMYNPNSDQYYNKHYRALGNLLISQYGGYTPLTPWKKKGTQENPYPLIDGSGLDATRIIVPLETGEGSSLFDKAIGRTNGFPTGGGYYDPYDPTTFEDYQGSIDEQRKSMLREKSQSGDVESKFRIPSGI